MASRQKTWTQKLEPNQLSYRIKHSKKDFSFFMKMIVYPFLFGIIYAFNENLSAVHYSIVTPGIEREIEPGNAAPLLSNHCYIFEYLS